MGRRRARFLPEMWYLDSEPRTFTLTLPGSNGSFAVIDASNASLLGLDAAVGLMVLGGDQHVVLLRSNG